LGDFPSFKTFEEKQQKINYRKRYFFNFWVNGWTRKIGAKDAENNWDDVERPEPRREKKSSGVKGSEKEKNINAFVFHTWRIRPTERPVNEGNNRRAKEAMDYPPKKGGFGERQNNRRLFGTKAPAGQP